MRAFISVALSLVAFGCAEPPSERIDFPPISAPDAGAASGDAGVDAADANIEIPDFVDGETALDWVNPMIGTSGVGFAYAGMTPSVQVPLGFMRVGPDTTRGGSHSEAFYHFSGYYWDDPHFRGFSHTHFVGTGTADYANLRVGFTDGSQRERGPRGWWLRKTEGSEVAEPGYFSASMDEGVDVELTATDHAAIHRYKVPVGTFMAIDPAASVDDDGVIDAQVTYADGVVSGVTTYKGDYVGRRNSFDLHFEVRIEPKPDDVTAWDGTAWVDADTMQGERAALSFTWPQDTDVELRVGISLIRGENATRRLTELEGETFETVRESTRARWAEILGRIELASDDPRQLEIFYTALYNSFRMPSRIDEYGEYPGIDGGIHTVDHPYYTDLSLWDTYRTLHPLWTLIAPDETRDVLNSLLLMGRDGGYIPRWPAGLSYTGGMEGDSAAMLFSEGAVKGIDGVDYAAAFELLKKTADAPVPAGSPYGGRDGIDDFISQGYISTDLHSAAASNTLEYSINDNALGVLAEFLGESDDAARYFDRAQNYRNVWHPTLRFFLPRFSDGSFDEELSVTKFNDRSGVFAEGSAWHYRFYAMHDPAGMIELFGGAEAFTAELDTFMEESKLFDGDRAVLLLPDPYYWHTNQPPLHVPFLYAAAGRPDLLDYWVGQILEFGYDITPDGLVGNDDGGTLSSWYVLATIGLFPTVGTAQWTTFAPRVPALRVLGAEPAWGGETGERDHHTLWQIQ